MMALGMRIVFVCRAYPTLRAGGMPFVCQDRAEALASMDYDVHVITTGGTAKRKAENINRVNIHYAECEPLAYSEQFAREAHGIVAALKPKVLHLDGCDVKRPWWTDFNDISAKALTLHGFGFGAFFTKWNAYRIGLTPTPPVFDALGQHAESQIFKTFDRVIAISHHELTLLRDHLGIASAQLVYNPIPDYFFDYGDAVGKDRSASLNYYLCAAISGHSERGFSIAEKACSVAGQSFRTLDSSARTKMPAKYDNAIALILPTTYAQGFDLTVAESIARRRPVIVSETGSYHREAEAFAPAIVTFPTGDVRRLIEIIKSPESLPVVPDGLAYQFRPDPHARSWLSSVWPWGS